MIETTPTPSPSSPRKSNLAAEKAYVRKVERRFIALRESGLYLSPRDFALLLDWYERGIPAELVVATIEELFVKAAARSESRKIQSIAYCKRAVEEAWEERRAALLGAAAAAPSPSRGALTPEEVAAHLSLAAEGTLKSAQILAPASSGSAGGAPLDPAVAHDSARSREALLAIAERISTLRTELLGGLPCDLRGLENDLVLLEAEALQAARSGLCAAEIAQLEQEAEASLAAFTGRMSPRARDATVRRALESSIRRRLSLPRYSLLTIVR